MNADGLTSSVISRGEEREREREEQREGREKIVNGNVDVVGDSGRSRKANKIHINIYYFLKSLKGIIEHDCLHENDIYFIFFHYACM